MVDGGQATSEWRRGAHVEIDESQVNAVGVARDGRTPSLRNWIDRAWRSFRPREGETLMAALLLLSGPSAGTRHEIKARSSLVAARPAPYFWRTRRSHVATFASSSRAGRRAFPTWGRANGTVVNGEKVETEVVMLPGDCLQVGDTTALFEPPTRAAFNDRATDEDASALPVEELVPVVGPAAGLYSAGVALLSATSEAMVLRRAAEACPGRQRRGRGRSLGRL